MKVHRWKSIAALAATLSLVFGAAPSQAATLVENTNVSTDSSASDLAKLPLTDRHLTKRAQLGILPDFASAVGTSAPGS